MFVFQISHLRVLLGATVNLDGPPLHILGVRLLLVRPSSQILIFLIGRMLSYLMDPRQAPVFSLFPWTCGLQEMRGLDSG